MLPLHQPDMLSFQRLQFPSPGRSPIQAGSAFALTYARQPAAVLVPNLTACLVLVAYAAEKLALGKFGSQFALVSVPPFGDRELFQLAAHVVKLQILCRLTLIAVASEQFDQVFLGGFVPPSVVL